MRYSKYNFWILAAIMVALIFFSSCITQEKCYERYPPSVKDSVSVHDTTIFDTMLVVIPSEAVIIHDTIPCPELNFEKTVTKNHVTAKIKIKDGKIDFECKADSLQRVLNKERKERVVTRTRSSVSKPLIVHKAYWYDIYFFRPLAGLSLLVLLAMLLLRYFRRSK